jgi:hypothetical protein
MNVVSFWDRAPFSLVEAYNVSEVLTASIIREPHILSNEILINYPIIRRCIILATDSMVKLSIVED